jgi:trehalose 6-phosphate synthase/phosphatase
VSRLLIVSNRLPVTVHRGAGGGVIVEKSPGGLATGLKGPHERHDGLWIGWPGDVSLFTPAERETVDAQLSAAHTVPIHLSPDEINRYYEGFSNGTLWPIFHYLLDRVPMDDGDWSMYEKINIKFADRIAEVYRDGDLVWVHDYQLLLVPALLRQRIPHARIGFFLHIPFPSSEIFRLLPQRERLLEGMLGADLIGFHTLDYLRHFGTALLRLLGVETDVDEIHYRGRSIRLGAFPMGVDAQAFDALGADPEVIAELAALREQSPGRRLLLGIDRLDYTKGIRRRLAAFERLLQNHPEHRGTVQLVQVAVPTRTAVEAYRDFRRSVDEIVGHLNGAFATASWTPVHYLYRSLSDKSVAALYRAADVMLVTPIRDGMNLVAKEFVASRSQEDGVLVLSEFAGAASELGEALQINPYNVEHVARAMHQALTMPPDEQRARMVAMRERVFTHTAQAWADSFTAALSIQSEKQSARVPDVAPARVVEGLLTELRTAQARVLLLDYDGTLVPVAPTPELAAPDEDVRDLLRALAAQAGTRVEIVTGRPRDVIAAWLGDLPVGLHAEHALWRRAVRGEWESRIPVLADWKPRLRPILESFTARTPGSFIEEKSAALAWHYRLANREFGALQAKELRLHLSEVLSHTPVEVLLGDKVVEVRLFGVNKGMVVPELVRQQPGAALVAMGNDRTDDDLFKATKAAGGITINVGPYWTSAEYRLPTVAAARAFLRGLL